MPPIARTKRTMALSIKRRAEPNTKFKQHKQQLIDVPLDVLIEIFLFLEPLDLLHLARTTKGLRAFLLSSRKSSALWKNAISNAKDFPPCPDHMSAPAYTHLAFVPVCHRCFCPCETVEWALRMRCCPDCFPKMTIPRSSLLFNMAGNGLNGFYLPAAHSHHKLKDSYRPVFGVYVKTVHHKVSCSLLDWKAARRRERPKGVSIEDFLTQQKNFLDSVQAHADLCRVWQHCRLKERAAQLTRVRQQRVESIKSRLEERGWTNNISDLDYFDHRFLKLPQVRKLEPLTTTEWTEIYPQLTEWLRRVFDEWIYGYRLAAYNSVISSVYQELIRDTSSKVQPQCIDIAMLPVVRSWVEVNTETDNNNLKKKLSCVLPSAIRKWSSNAVKELEQFARQELDLPPLSKPFYLPSVIFRCRVCQQRLRFGEALSHRHLYKAKMRRKTHKPESPCKKSIYDQFLMGYDTHPRNTQVLQVDVTASRRVGNLVRRIGQNPSRATFDKLCHSTVKVVCGLCRPEVATKMVFKRAFEHCLDTHPGKVTEMWTRVPARE